MMNYTENIHYFRPKGKHLLTIGKDLIQDQHAALIELVKNAYDADSEVVNIHFIGNGEGIEIIVEDFGHGMTRETVIDKWLVPSTDDKIDRKYSSEKGRLMQGRKGIGRYSASILGGNMVMSTVDRKGNETIIEVDWEEFNNADFLSDVPVNVETNKTNKKSGTSIHIFGQKEYLDLWTRSNFKEIKKLTNQLRRLKKPEEISENHKDKFSILLHLGKDFNKGNVEDVIEIAPYKIFEFYDYRISGKLDEEGNLDFEFHNQRISKSVPEIFSEKVELDILCGPISFDFRVFDREPSAIEHLVARGLKDEDGEPLGKREARRLLDHLNGVSVYRNEFRIRPLGEPGFDWLKLNSRRVQQPTLNIGSNQVIGQISIESEEISHLDEKSARDGLKDNIYYSNLITISIFVLRILELKRFKYRKMVGLGRDSGKVEEKLRDVFEFDGMREKTVKELKKMGLSEEATGKIIEIINKEEKSKSHIFEEIRKAIAIYQGQATLGKIITVVLHEGRKPLSFFRTQAKNMKFWAAELLEDYTQQNQNEIIEKMDGFEENAKFLSTLFKRLDPLALNRRGERKDFSLLKAIELSLNVFEQELLDQQIEVDVNCGEQILISGWIEDFVVIFTNLLDNSIYWLRNTQKKRINIFVRDEDEIYIDFHDNGEGIPEDYLENQLIFEPEFSLKPNDEGTGLGLAICGEAAERNGFKILAVGSDEGAYFQLIRSIGRSNE